MRAALYRILTIGRNTLLESVRQKVLNVLLIFAVVLVGASIWFSDVATPELDQAGLFDAQIKFVKDAGCGAIGVFGFFIALLSTAQLIPQELHNRTIYTILAKPVRRGEFLLGKFLARNRPCIATSKAGASSSTTVSKPGSSPRPSRSSKTPPFATSATLVRRISCASSSKRRPCRRASH